MQTTFNKSLLKSKMAINNDTDKTLSEKIGLSRTFLNNKINGHSDFKAKEIKAIMDNYKLTPEEVVEIFLK